MHLNNTEMYSIRNRDTKECYWNRIAITAIRTTDLISQEQNI